MNYTDLTFFTNEPNRTLLDRFKRILRSNTKYFDILVGYFRISGFYLLYDALEDIEKIRVLVGINIDRKTFDLLQKGQRILTFNQLEVKEQLKEEFIRELENSEDLAEIEEGALKFIEFVKKGKLEIRAYPKPLHAKVYIIRKDPEKSDDFGKVITGSSNFTQAGLIDNLEFNVELKNRIDVEFALTKFEELWKNSIPLDERFVEDIKRKTWINDTLTPYELYLKFLYEYLKDKIDLDKKQLSDYEDYPEGFKLLEYQKEAVIDAKSKIEQFGGVFLSDVVGLGKTYISVLLAKELGGRNLVIAPPHLVEYWESVFRDFNVYVKVISIGKLDKLLENDIHKNFKNLFIDEAHKFRNEDTQSYEKLHQIAQGKRVILISATPYNNRPKDIANLLFLFQKRKNSTIPTTRDLEHFFNSLEKRLKSIDRKKERGKYLKEVKNIAKIMREKVLKYVMVRRTRREILEFFGKDLEKQGLKFPELKEPKKVYYIFNEEIDNLFNETLKFIENFGYVRYYPLQFLKKPLKENDPLVISQKNLKGFMRTRLLKRLESSFEAFKKSLENFINSYKNFISMYEKGTIYISKQINVYDYIENDREDELLQLIESGEKKIKKFTVEDFKPEFKEKLYKDLKDLKELYNKWKKINTDPKVERLKQLINEEKLKDKKVILFTEFIDTAEYLKKHLKDIFKDRVFLYTSKSKKEAREKIERNFNPTHPNPEDSIDFLITTDTLAEGINLHKSNIIINYDIPWNPTKVLQRVGRINRIGTKHKYIYIYNFFPVAQIEKHIGLEASALAKLQAFHHALGEDAKYLDPEVEEIDTHKLFTVINSVRSLTDEEEEDTELEYLKILREIRDNEPELLNKIKRLPKKSKSSKKGEEKAVITLLKKGKLMKVFITKEDGITEEIDFFEAVKQLKCSPDEKRLKIDKDFYQMLNKNKEEFKKIFIEEKVKRQSSRNQTFKFITHLKALMNYSELDEESKKFLIKVLEKAKEGVFPEKTLLKRINREIKATNNTLKKVDIIKNSIPESYLEDEDRREEKDDIEVVLSVYLKKD
ncbi:MAG: helicase [Persephonella sp.]|nr:MAG: helicase [Persephonella sp.]